MASDIAFDPANRARLLTHLFSRVSGDIRLGLDRIRGAAAARGNPQDACNAIHVAGTNGKGSVCAMCEAILREAGFKTGLYTSPHLVEFEERFRINNQIIDPRRWLAIYDEIMPLADAWSLTFFEIATLLAFELFRRERVEWAIVETGLGGRLDATTIMNRPAATVITRIGLDHMRYLGSTIEQVAREKLGIVKGGVPLVLGAQDYRAVERLARRICAQSQAPCIAPGEDPAGEALLQKALPLALAGDYQLDNARCAITACRIAANVSDAAAIRGLRTAALPARFQMLRRGRATVILDIAHNPAAAARLVDTIEASAAPRPRIFVAGIMADKDCAAMIARYRRAGDTLILCRPDTPRAASIEQLEEAAREHWPCAAMQRAGSPRDAYRRALEAAGAGSVIVTGSFFTVGEVMREDVRGDMLEGSGFC
jgi:dihydrofolate synthase/folylpolyglutamate synthase